MNPDGDQSPKTQQQPLPLTCEELMCEEGSDCIMRQQGEGEGEGGKHRGAVCKRRNIDDSDASRGPSSDDRRSNNRQRLSIESGGRLNGN